MYLIPLFDFAMPKLPHDGLYKDVQLWLLTMLHALNAASEACVNCSAILN